MSDGIYIDHCPLCGNGNIYAYHVKSWGNTAVGVVECRECHTRHEHRIDNDERLCRERRQEALAAAIEEWNDRSRA